MTPMRVYTDNHLAAEPWRDSAACLEIPGDTFFPAQQDSVTAAIARRICGGCGVSDACLQSALERNEQFGIYGGLTAKQRRSLRAKSAAEVNA